MSLMQNTKETTNAVILANNTQTTRSYNRILVLLDNSQAGERAIAAALEMARPLETEIILIAPDEPGVQSFINSKCANLQQQRMTAHGYTISQNLDDIPLWVIESEKAEAVIVAQKTTSWLGRLLGDNVATKLGARLQADVYTIEV